MSGDAEKVYYLIELEKISEIVSGLQMLVAQDGVSEEVISKVNKLKASVKKMKNLTDEKLKI